MRTLIVDGQMWQTNAYFRGMGGYAFGLLNALMARDSELDLHIVLNTRMVHDQARLDGIKSWLPTAQLHLLDLPLEPKPDVGEEARAVAALDKFVEELEVDTSQMYYFIPALFLFQYCAVFPTKARKVLLFHDLMPLIYREELGKYFPAHIYFPRFRTIFEADLIVTNSQTTAADLLAYTGADDTRVVNIDGSLNERLVHDDRIAQDVRGIRERLGLRDVPYIIMPTGGLENKNNIRAAEAFRLLCDAGNTKTQLVVTSFFDEAAREELTLIAGDRITFTGNISNEDLLELYTGCSVVLMPSLYEGLGLPVLEGVAHDKPVACSDVPVFREMPHFEEALYVFDPFDAEAIAQALDNALHQAGFAAKKRLYTRILEKYSWQRSAELFDKALWHEAHFTKVVPPARRLAVVCPDPRKNQDVAVFAQRLYGYARRAGVEVVYFIDPGGDDEIGVPLQPDYIRWIARCYDVDAIYSRLQTESFDGVLHFLKADAYFAKIFRVAASIPGYVYISDSGYTAVIDALEDQGMVSASQAEAEKQIMQSCDEQRAFDALSAIVLAPGLVVEQPLATPVKRAQKLLGADIPVLQVSPCREVNAAADVEAAQRQAYGELLAFIGGKK